MKRNVKRRVVTEQKLEEIGERLEKIVNVIWVCWNIRDSPGVSSGLACTRYRRPSRTVNSLYIWGFRACQHLRSLASVMNDDNDGQMIFVDLGGLKLPNICLTGEEKPRRNLTQETFPDRGSNPGLLRDRHACYHLAHSSGLIGHMELGLLRGFGQPYLIIVDTHCPKWKLPIKKWNSQTSIKVTYSPIALKSSFYVLKLANLLFL